MSKRSAAAALIDNEDDRKPAAIVDAEEATTSTKTTFTIRLFEPLEQTLINKLNNLRTENNEYDHLELLGPRIDVNDKDELNEVFLDNEETIRDYRRLSLPLFASIGKVKDLIKLSLLMDAHTADVFDHGIDDWFCPSILIPILTDAASLQELTTSPMMIKTDTGRDNLVDEFATALRNCQELRRVFITCIYYQGCGIDSIVRAFSELTRLVHLKLSIDELTTAGTLTTHQTLSTESLLQSSSLQELDLSNSKFSATILYSIRTADFSATLKRLLLCNVELNPTIFDGWMTMLQENATSLEYFDCSCDFDETKRQEITAESQNRYLSSLRCMLQNNSNTVVKVSAYCFPVDLNLAEDDIGRVILLQTYHR